MSGIGIHAAWLTLVTKFYDNNWIRLFGSSFNMSLLGDNLKSYWCLVLAAAATCVRAKIELELSLEMPDTALPIPAGMCGLSIEADRFVDWAGEPGDANQFTYNLMNNIKDRTGVAPPIR